MDLLYVKLCWIYRYSLQSFNIFRLNLIVEHLFSVLFYFFSCKCLIQMLHLIYPPASNCSFRLIVNARCIIELILLTSNDGGSVSLLLNFCNDLDIILYMIFISNLLASMISSQIDTI